MKPEKKEKVVAALLRKGFVEDNSHHRYFRYSPGGKSTGVYTFISHGHTECSSAILTNMKNQLHLTQDQLKDLIDCPLTKEQLEEIYRKQGLLPDPDREKTRSGRNRCCAVNISRRCAGLCARTKSTYLSKQRHVRI